MSEQTRVGFIGLGGMGLPMAERVVKAGFPTFTTFHRRREPADHLASLGARILDSPAEIARAAEVVITIVPADAELREIALGPAGLLEGFSPGKVLIEMSTTTAIGMVEVAAAAEKAGVCVLDAPVSGGTAGAAAGTLTIMVGGDAEVLEKWRPLLEIMGRRILRVGPVGQGKVVKMVNQTLAAAHIVALGEAFALGVRCGADPATLYAVIKDSSGYSRMMDLRVPMLRSGSFEPGFKLDLMKKDVSLAMDSARAEGVPMLLTATVAQILSAVSAAGNGESDYAIAAQFLAGLANVNLSEPKGAGA